MGREETTTTTTELDEPEPELTAAAKPEPQPEPGARSRWIKPLSCYERRETTVVEGLRYG
jgi:hypothetical protein